MKKYSISVDVTENDLRELLSGNTFEWTFTTKEDKNVIINVNLFNPDDVVCY